MQLQHINMDELLKILGTKANVARFFNVTPQALTSWAKPDKNYVPQGRRYEFLSRRSEWDNTQSK